MTPENTIEGTNKSLIVNKDGSYTELSRADKNRLNGKLGGRPKGKKLARTIEKEKIQKHVESFYQKRAFKLARASMSPALGQMFIYKIEEEVTGHGPKGGEYVKRKHTLVDSPSEIERALDYMDGMGQGTDDENNMYYYITTKEPDTNAIDKIFNRAFGKPKESMDLNLDVTFSLRGLAAKRAILNGEQVDAEIMKPE